MKAAFLFSVSLGLFCQTTYAATDFTCMQDCLQRGYDRHYCSGICTGEVPGSSISEQAGVPENPAFEQVKPKFPQQPLPQRIDKKCMKDCTGRGYSYMFCRKQCSF